MSFTKFSKPKGPKEFSLETVDVKHATINMTWPDAEDFSDASNAVDFSLPLVPITRSRRIEAGMGNIVRRVSDETDGTGSIPASQELEEAVSAYFKVKEIPPHAMIVWALVYPAAIKDGKELPGQDSTGGSTVKEDVVGGSVLSFIQSSLGSPPSEWSSYIWTALKEGARLHRVLSGGGGWGKKAGLLSLDPDSSYSASSAGVDEADLSGSNFAMNEKQALGEVSKPGDYVQFFVAQDEPAQAELTLDASADNRVAAQQSLHFGTIPSSIDLIPEDPGTASVPSGKPALETFRNHFGALSETGIGIVIKRRILIQQRRPKRDSILDEERTKTKIDVPFSAFRIQAAGQSLNFQKGGKDGESKAPKMFTIPAPAMKGNPLHSPRERLQGVRRPPIYPVRRSAVAPFYPRRVPSTPAYARRYSSTHTVRGGRDSDSYVYSAHTLHSDVPMPAPIHNKAQTDSNPSRRGRSGTNVHTPQQKPSQNPATIRLSEGTTRGETVQPSQSQDRELSELVRYELIDPAKEDRHEQDMTVKQALASFQSLPTAQGQQGRLRITKHAMPMLSRRAFVRQRNKRERHDPDSALKQASNYFRSQHVAQDQQNEVRITKHFHGRNLLEEKRQLQKERRQHRNKDPATLDRPIEERIRFAKTSPSATELQREAQLDRYRLHQNKVFRAQQAHLSDRAEFDPIVLALAPAPIEKLVHRHESAPSAKKEAQADEARARAERLLRAQQAYLAAAERDPTVVVSMTEMPAEVSIRKHFYRHTTEPEAAVEPPAQNHDEAQSAHTASAQPVKRKSRNAKRLDYQLHKERRSRIRRITTTPLPRFYVYNPTPRVPRRRLQQPQIRKHEVDPPPAKEAAEDAVGMEDATPETSRTGRARPGLRLRRVDLGPKVRLLQYPSASPRRTDSTPGRGIERLRARRAKAAEEAWAVLTGGWTGRGLLSSRVRRI
ncbi:hypothetical protein H2199_006779 [Coniosporium tulheliwenetii]|uniref:Uncharacterized protein n=1 Tax=Coniosporium tulheliwenetii TaxID=3383036 RepID=A0ACC2YU84_9PEZI|nr:hypothetical protein H2199_006779 [Cladosporium sp. JES 115]